MTTEPSNANNLLINRPSIRNPLGELLRYVEARTVRPREATK